jgi:hypothetical protein
VPSDEDPPQDDVAPELCLYSTSQPNPAIRPIRDLPPDLDTNAASGESYIARTESLTPVVSRVVPPILLPDTPNAQIKVGMSVGACKARDVVSCKTDI